MFHVTESNRLEGLCHAFKQLAFHSSKNPFTKRSVLVPSSAFKTYLKMDLANDPLIGIAFGLDVSTYEEGLIHLAHLFLKQARKRDVPTLLELTMRIQLELIALTDTACKDLEKYTKGLPTRAAEKKLYHLAKNLARLFLNYGRFAPTSLCGDADTLQITLFQKIFHPESRWTTRLETLIQPLNDTLVENLEIFIFAPFMTQGEIDFLKRISQKVPVELFSMVPTTYLLDDHLTDREEKKNKDSPFEKNVFIANYSMLYRETQKAIIDQTDLVSSIYLVDAVCADDPEWNTLIRNDHILVGSGHPTLLKAFQTDLALMRIPQTHIEIQEETLSIQYHSASTRYREIQILYNQLLSMMETHPLRPIDIQVFAKDILPYEPYIKAVFGNSRSLIKYSLHGEKAATYPLVQAFLNLLSFERLDAEHLMGLLEFPSFRKQWQFSSKDVHTIRSLVHEESFRWGNSLEDKNAYFQKKGFEKGVFDTYPFGTKEAFEQRLVERFVSDSSIDINDADMIASLLRLLNTLSEDCAYFISDIKHTLAEWSLLFKKMLHRYFDAENDDSALFIEKKIQSLALNDPVVSETPCLFQTALSCLNDALNKGMQRDKDDELNTVKFSSLLPHHAMPSQAIALIGLVDGLFPSSTPHDHLDLLKKSGTLIPKNADVDRFLFMEAILSARAFLYLSSSKNNEEDRPSTVIFDLFQYLDSAFIVNGKTPSTLCCFTHPKTHYDPSYFEEHSPKKNYSDVHYRECLATLKKSPVRSFSKKTVSDSSKIEIKDLVNFLRNPLKSYLQKTERLYLPTHKEDRFSLCLPKTDYYRLERTFLTPMEDSEFLKMAENLPSMPPKLFRDLEIQKLAEKKHAIRNGLKQFGLTPSHLTTINLLPYEDSALIEEPGCFYHKGIVIKNNLLFGSIEQVSDQGIVRTIGSQRIKDLLAACLESAILKTIHRPATLLLIGKRIVECSIPENYLESVIDLYHEGLKSPLLLLPDFLVAIRDGDEARLKKEINQAFNPFKETKDSLLLQWAYGNERALSAQELIDQLQEKAAILLKPFEDRL